MVYENLHENKMELAFKQWKEQVFTLVDFTGVSTDKKKSYLSDRNRVQDYFLNSGGNTDNIRPELTFSLGLFYLINLKLRRYVYEN